LPMLDERARQRISYGSTPRRKTRARDVHQVERAAS
jgi:hypothetical protein